MIRFEKVQRTWFRGQPETPKDRNIIILQ